MPLRVIFPHIPLQLSFVLIDYFGTFFITIEMEGIQYISEAKYRERGPEASCNVVQYVTVLGFQIFVDFIELVCHFVLCRLI